MMSRKKRLMKENKELKTAVAEAEQATIETMLELKVVKEGLAKATPLSPKGLESLAEQYPQWSISLGMSEDKPSKTFTRTLTDLDPELARERDTYLRFCDPEYFDDTLRGIFDTYSASGDFYGKADGDFDGGNFTINVYSVDRLELTIHDANCIELAEQYLKDTEFGSKSLLEAAQTV